MKKYLMPSVILMMGAILSGTPRVPQQSPVSNEEYAIYSIVIGDMFAGSKVTFDTQSRIKVLVIKDHTVNDVLAFVVERDDWKYVKQRFPSLSQDALSDFVAKNKSAHQLKDAFKIDLNHTLVKKDEFDQIFKGGVNGWEEFYKRFPDSGGYIGISRAGLNPAMSQALIYVEHGCGGLCGTGHYLLLEKSDGIWKVTRKFRAWIS
jgi:hypothetical protein